jgi:hypothetical protein
MRMCFVTPNSVVYKCLGITLEDVANMFLRNVRTNLPKYMASMSRGPQYESSLPGKPQFLAILILPSGAAPHTSHSPFESMTATVS